jgi:hypothetical protein
MNAATNTDTYNGWVNRETWAAALVLGNDQDLYDITRYIVSEEDQNQREWREEHGIVGNECDVEQFAADRLEDWITTSVSDFLWATTSSPDAWRSNAWVRQLIAEVGSFDRVDWRAVADSFREES